MLYVWRRTIRAELVIHTHTTEWHVEQLSVSMKCLACCLQLSQKVKHPHQQVAEVLRRSRERLVLMPIYRVEDCHSFKQRSCTTALHAMLVACMPFRLHTYCHAPSWRYVYTPAGLSARHDAHNTVNNICSRARAPPQCQNTIKTQVKEYHSTTKWHLGWIKTG